MPRAAASLASLLVALAARADLPSLDLDPAFPGLRVHPLRIDGPTVPGGTTGLAVLESPRQLNGQQLPAGTLLASFGTVAGGENNRVYAVDPDTGDVLPDLSVSYGPASGDGRPDAGLLLLDANRYLSFQFAPVGIVLGRFDEDGPGTLLDTEHLPGAQFSNGGGMGLLDNDTLYITSFQQNSLYTIDFAVSGDGLLLSNLTLVNPFMPGPGPDGVAIIPPNAAGELADHAGELVMARFGGNGDGFVTIHDRQGDLIRIVATYHKNDAIGFIGPDGVTFGPDGSLYVSDFDQTIFKVSSVPEPATALLLLACTALMARRPS